MCERFLKFIPSEEAMFLVTHKKLAYLNAFRLLTIIAERARRYDGHPDGLKIGECHLGDWKSYGLTEKEYRTAKKILVERNHIEIVETCRSRKKEKNQTNSFNFGKVKKVATERATNVTTTGTLVKLCSITVYNINSSDTKHQSGDRKGDRGATEGRPRGDEQERIRKNKKEKEEQPLTPSLPIPPKIKFRQFVELTQEQHDSLLSQHGAEFLKKMLDALDSYKGSSGTTYKSDFHTMKEGGWVVERVKKELLTQKTGYERTQQQPTQSGTQSSKFQGSRVLRGSNNAVEGDN